MSNPYPFSDPASGDKLPLDELEGALLMIDVKEHGPEMQTSFGPATPVRADVFVLDGPRKAEEFADALIFPRVLIGQLRTSVGAKVLGRLGKGTAKPGQSAPWRLDVATDTDRAIGERFVAHHAAEVASFEEPF